MSSAPLSNGPAEEIYDCWSRIGVLGGDGSCVELEKFIHCRNCPVYSAAGAKLLDRALPIDYRQDWTEHFSRAKQIATPGRTSAVVFRIGTEWLALPTSVFQEVAERRAIHSLPHRRHGFVLGLINIRGELLVCVSLGRLLGLEKETKMEKPRTMYDRLLVANWDSQRLTFPVEEVYGIHRFHLEELKDPPATIAKANPTYTRGLLPWQKRNVGFLDAELVFSTLNRSLT